MCSQAISLDHVSSWIKQIYIINPPVRQRNDAVNGTLLSKRAHPVGRPVLLLEGPVYKLPSVPMLDTGAAPSWLSTSMARAIKVGRWTPDSPGISIWEICSAAAGSMVEIWAKSCRLICSSSEASETDVSFTEGLRTLQACTEQTGFTLSLLWPSTLCYASCHPADHPLEPKSKCRSVKGLSHFPDSIHGRVCGI